MGADTFGTGNTLGTVASFPGVTVDGVEIDRNVVSMAHWFSRWNHDAINRDNVRRTYQGARGFIHDVVESGLRRFGDEIVVSDVFLYQLLIDLSLIAQDPDAAYD